MLWEQSLNMMSIIWFNPETKEEVFDRNLEIENDTRLYDIYKKKMNLSASSENKNIDESKR